MPRLLTILLALAIAAPGCLCPLLHGLGCGQHHHDTHSNAPVSCFAAPDCPHSHVLCGHDDPMPPRVGAPETGVTPDFNPAAFLALSFEDVNSLARPERGSPISRGPPPPTGAVGRQARIVFHSFLL